MIHVDDLKSSLAKIKKSIASGESEVALSNLRQLIKLKDEYAQGLNAANWDLAGIIQNNKDVAPLLMPLYTALYREEEEAYLDVFKCERLYTSIRDRHAEKEPVVEAADAQQEAQSFSVFKNFSVFSNP